MSQQRQFQMVSGNNNNPGAGQYSDTTFTKIFVGGLAWETQRDTMKRYFEQFGEIVEAVVITDKNTGRSKGYGFVTFKDPDATMRACENPSPTIDGRRANCNLASLGAQKTRPLTPQHGGGRFIPAPRLMASPVYHGSSSAFIQQPNGQYSIPYSAYGYTGYSQDGIYPLNYYSLYGGQQFSPYYATGTSMTPGMFHNLYPFYAQHGQNSQAHGFGVQYPHMLKYPYLPHQYSSTGIFSLPSSLPMAETSTATTTETTTATKTTASATSTTPPMSSSETEKTLSITEPLTTATIAPTGVVEAETGPSQASGTPTEKKPSS
ncbi:RNA-binding protein 38-like [Hibiscus syriacus]|uniref:RNA-binding protein 38-like n=1 Tax=Hibiscus syriacus TaxID=106335 RepID=UPI001924E641|nr:RNA-binding protein 38-like [Hibiscus syriacus]